MNKERLFAAGKQVCAYLEVISRDVFRTRGAEVLIVDDGLSAWVGCLCLDKPPVLVVTIGRDDALEYRVMAGGLGSAAGQPMSLMSALLEVAVITTDRAIQQGAIEHWCEDMRGINHG